MNLLRELIIYMPVLFFVITQIIRNNLILNFTTAILMIPIIFLLVENWKLTKTNPMVKP